MKPDPKKKPRKRPPVRSRNGQCRNKAIQIKFSEEEFRQVRRKLGRLAAAIARDYLLGLETKAHSIADRESDLRMLRALHGFDSEIARLIRKFAAKPSDSRILKLMESIQQEFNKVIRVWSSNFSAATKKI
jgi:hypothetical protein